MLGLIVIVLEVESWLLLRLQPLLSSHPRALPQDGFGRKEAAGQAKGTNQVRLVKVRFLQDHRLEVDLSGLGENEEDKIHREEDQQQSGDGDDVDDEDDVREKLLQQQQPLLLLRGDVQTWRLLDGKSQQLRDVHVEGLTWVFCNAFSS